MPAISRRHLLGLLAGFLAPASRASHPPGLATTFHRDAKPFAPSATRPGSDFTDPSGLDAWRRLPILPLADFKSFSSVAHTDQEQFLGRWILANLANQTDFEFCYLGGSDLGSTRRVHPILLFRKSEMACGHHDQPLIYLLAFCHTRQQARTFRLDRISMR